MGRVATVVLPVLTLVLGVALGKWWSDREHVADRGRVQAARATERNPAVPSSAEEPGRTEIAKTPAPAAIEPVNDHRADPAPAPTRKAPPAVLTPELKHPATRDKQGAGAAAPKEPAEPSAPPASGTDEGAAKMLAVLFTNPAYRDMMIKQMVDQVAQRVTFTDSQREAAKKELDGALQPLVEAFQNGPMEMKDLDPKFQVVKEDWKRRLTPLLTAEQGLAFQSWLDEKHSLQVKMGMDEKGNPKDPDEHDDK